MTHPHQDHDDLDMELLSAYVDGTLPEEDRRRAEHVLATSEAAREVVAEAVRLREDLGLPGPGRQARTLLARWSVPALAAAALAALVLVPALRQGTSATGPLPPEVFTSLPEGWRERSWGVTRSFRATLAPEVVAFRLGTQWTDAALAWEAGDGSTARSFLGPMAQLLAGVPLAAPARALVEEAAERAVAGAAWSEGEPLLAEARGRLEGTLPLDHLEAGLWLEGLRLAALAGRQDLLAGLSTPPAAAAPAFPPDAAGDLDALRALAGRPSLAPEERQTLLGHVAALQALLGG